jgi:5,5'-dehydrodivanillate O-demethylase
MLDHDTNERLTRVGPGTPMGELMRRYWQPIAAASEFDDDRTTKPVRLMGENLVLYKDLSGNFGLIDRHCCHRSADLSYGFVEKHGLRCNYHGWLYDHDGNCLEMPYEDHAAPNSGFKDSIKIKSYPVEEKRGLLWAYLGPEPRPLVPNWEPFTWENGFVQIVFAEIPCNWFQCQENSIDPVHFEWMHENWSGRLRGEDGEYTPTHTKVGFDEFDFGFVYRRVREGSSEDDPLWKVGRVCLWPNALFTGSHFEWRVPVDDETTLSVTWVFSRVPKDKEPYVQNSIPHWYGPIKNLETGRWIDSHVMNQDFIAWVGQGTVTDRSREHLGQSDKGIVMIRRRFLEDMKAIERGEDPKAVIRDPEVNACVDLPIVTRKFLVEGLTREQIAEIGSRANVITPYLYVFQAGQPEHVRKAYEAATGIALSRETFVEDGGRKSGTLLVNQVE